AVDGVGARHAGDAGVRAPLPERFAGLAVERTEVAVVGAAGEDEAAAGREHRPPVVRLECAYPHFLTGVHVPSLDLTDVLGAFGEIHPDVLDLGAQPDLARLVRLGRAQQRRRNLVPGPGIIPVVLVIRADLARVGVEREHRGRIEVVARALIAHPLRTVAGAPVGEIQLGIVVAGDPDRRPARLPRIALPR